MASRSLNLYTGVTGNLSQRVLQHKAGEVEAFTKRYNIGRLVYYEVFEHIGSAIACEKQIKGWTRAKRLALIKSMNPAWQDLAEAGANKPNCRSLAPLVMTGLLVSIRTQSIMKA
jgi:putative endonuclease